MKLTENDFRELKFKNYTSINLDKKDLRIIKTANFIASTFVLVFCTFLFLELDYRFKFYESYAISTIFYIVIFFVVQIVINKVKLNFLNKKVFEKY